MTGSEYQVGLILAPSRLILALSQAILASYWALLGLSWRNLGPWPYLAKTGYVTFVAPESGMVRGLILVPSWLVFALRGWLRG